MKKILYIAIALIFSFSEAKAIENNCSNPEVGYVYYSDGTCSASNNASKNAIGVVYWVLENGKKNTFNVMTLEDVAASGLHAPPSSGYCTSYSKNGVTGWKIPSIMELIPMGVEKPSGVSNDKFAILNAKLATITGAKQMTSYAYWSSSYYYEDIDNNGKSVFTPRTGGIGESEGYYDEFDGYNIKLRFILTF